MPLSTEHHSAGPRVAVLGAGIIGQVLAAKLDAAGNDVVLVARGATRDQLLADGVRLRTRGRDEQRRVPIVDVADPGSRDIVLLCLRATDLPGLLPVIDQMGAPLVVPIMHMGNQLDRLTAHVGADRIVSAFPGLGGLRASDGVVEWLEVGFGQPTTVDARAAQAGRVVDLLKGTGLVVATTNDMDSWMATHVIFVGTLGAGLLLSGGDRFRLAGDRALLRRTIDAIVDGLRGLQDRGHQIEPWPIAMLFLRAPRWVAVSYWRRALRGELGRVTIAPHVWRSRKDEMPALLHAAIDLTDGTAPIMSELANEARIAAERS